MIILQLTDEIKLFYFVVSQWFVLLISLNKEKLIYIVKFLKLKKIIDFYKMEGDFYIFFRNNLSQIIQILQIFCSCSGALQKNGTN